MKTAFIKIKFKLETPSSIIIHQLRKIILGKQKADKLKRQRNSKWMKKKYFKGDHWDFDGIKTSIYSPDQDYCIMYSIFLDSLFVYCMHNDNYSNSQIDMLDLVLPEGTYGYQNKEIDVTVKPNDFVIDAGAWIGDFSAYASMKGATVFAFEPSKETVEFLKETKDLNKNIQIVEKGLGDKSGIFFLSNDHSNSGANRISEENNILEKIEVTTIDEFVIENNLNRIDFIKADIEGFERYMLAGAKETLKRFAPKLAICTYHLPDDPEVLSKIILDANPNYIIVQKNKKLFAMAFPK